MQKGRTPLHYAAVNGDDALIDHLIAAGAKLNERDKWDYTILDYARKYGYTELDNKLIAMGAEASKAHYKPEELQAGECRNWYTGHSGWVIETMNQILVFDYWKRLEPGDEASIKNGCLTREFLDCEKPVSIFVSHVHSDHYDERIFEFADLDNVEYFFGFQPSREERLTLLTAQEPVTRNNLEIFPIYSNDSGVGFLVEADGIVIFHAGDHANRERDLSGDYLPEIDYLSGLEKNIDLAFMPIRGCNFGDNEAVRIGVYKTLDILHPNYFIPMHAGSDESHYANFNQVLSEAGYDLNKFAAMDTGDRFTYRK